MTGVDLAGVHQRYGPEPVLEGVDLRVEAGSFTAVLGRSGSGKTTLLRVIAGFEHIEAGQVSIDGRVVDDGHRRVAPERRRVGYVAQDGALFPHLDVAANVAFGVRRRRRSPGRLGDLLDMVGLAGLERRYPHQLSGGQQQRVALARALATEPGVILLDEPFSSLDAGLRAAVRSDVADILRRAGTTTVLVTHDQDEALSLADRVAVLRGGRFVACADPERLYTEPVDAELATFLGAANLLAASISEGTAQTALGPVALLPAAGGSPEGGVSGGGGGGVVAGASGGRATVLIRPEQITATPLDPGGTGTGTGLVGRVVACDYYGHDAMLRVGAPGSELLVRVSGRDALAPGTEVRLRGRGPVMAWPEALRHDPETPAPGDRLDPSLTPGSG